MIENIIENLEPQHASLKNTISQVSDMVESDNQDHVAIIDGLEKFTQILKEYIKL